MGEVCRGASRWQSRESLSILAALDEEDNGTDEGDGEHGIARHDHAHMNGQQEAVLKRRNERHYLIWKERRDAQHDGDDRKRDKSESSLTVPRLEGQVGHGYGKCEANGELVQVGHGRVTDGDPTRCD